MKIKAMYSISAFISGVFNPVSKIYLGKHLALLLCAGFSLNAGTIIGKVGDQNGKPLDSVVVRLRSNSFIADTTLIQNKMSNVFADSNGFYKFNNVDNGIYTIEASFKDSLGASVRSIEVYIDTSVVPTLNLEVLCFVKGQVKLLNNQDTAIKVFIASAGLDHITRANSDGNFLIELPKGYINLVIFTSSAVFSKYNSLIQLIPGDTLNLGIITLQKNAPIAYKPVNPHPEKDYSGYRCFDLRGRDITSINTHSYIPYISKNKNMNKYKINILTNR